MDTTELKQLADLLRDAAEDTDDDCVRDARRYFSEQIENTITNDKEHHPPPGPPSGGIHH